MSTVRLIQDVAYAQTLLKSSARAAINQAHTLENSRNIHLQKLTGEATTKTGDVFRGRLSKGTLSSLPQIEEAYAALSASLDTIMQNPREYGIE